MRGTTRSGLVRIGPALKPPRVLQRLGELGLTPVGGTSQNFADFIATDIERWRKVIIAAKIEPDP